MKSKQTSSSSSGLTRLRRRIVRLSNKQSDEDTKNRLLVFQVVLAGTLVLCGLLVFLLAVSYFALDNHYVKSRLIWGVALFAYLSLIAVLIYKYQAYKASAPMFVAFYALTAAASVWLWGINSVFALLLFSLVIVLAGIIIRARYALVMALTASLVLAGTQIAIMHGHQLVGSAIRSSNFGQVIGYSIIFFIIALICWLYSNQMERSLHKAARAELLLQAQKANLEKMVQKRTAALEEKRIHELEQMYRFTQVSALSTGLLHDLANYVTILSLDIENLHTKHRSQTLQRASQTIAYIDDMVNGVRQQLQGESQTAVFNSADATQEVITILQHKAAQAGVTIAWQEPSNKNDLLVEGDLIRFNQVITIFITNAIEAYDKKTTGATVAVSVGRSAEKVVITISDTGKGIDMAQRQTLFKPFHSDKKGGMGIGLFLARQIIQEHFKGKVRLDPALERTTFTITIPAR